MKTCLTCKQAKPEGEFPVRRAGKLRPHCRPCYNEKRKGSEAVLPAPADPLKSALDSRQNNAFQARLQSENAALGKEVERLQRELEASRGVREPVPLTVIVKGPSGVQGEAVAGALASDWHVEEEVEAEKVHGINEYNLEVAERRSQHYFKNFLRLADLQARECSIKRIYLGLLGDFFSNFIHEELQETNLLGPTPAAKFAKKLIIDGIEFLLRESSYSIDIDAVAGNHGRMTKKNRIQNATETSLETFMYEAIADRYHNNPRVQMRVAQSKMVYRRYFERFVLRVIHGDDIKFGGGVGGITIPIRKKLAAWDKAQPATLTVMGHFHQRMDGGDFLVNGSLIGYNEFAQAIGASPEQPQQQFFLIHARGGGEKSVVAPIWLDAAHRAGKKVA